MRIFSITLQNRFQEYVEIPFQGEHQETLLEVWLENNPDAIIEGGRWAQTWAASSTCWL